MSTTYTTYLMLGIKTTQEESGWLLYIEGHPEDCYACTCSPDGKILTENT